MVARKTTAKALTPAPSPAAAGEESTKDVAGVPMARVRFLERVSSPSRGTFEPGDEAEVALRRAAIWFEGRVVEIAQADGSWLSPGTAGGEPMAGIEVAEGETGELVQE